eukprot:COSAG01_NODE_4460_length_5003_cov_6.216150_8_plen_118_part_00
MYKAIVRSVPVCIRGMRYGAPPGLTCSGAIAVLTCSSTVHIHVQLYSCTRTVPDTVPVHTSTSIQLLLYSCTRSLLCSTTHVHRGGGGAHPSMPEAGKARRGGELPADQGDLNSVVS